MADAHPLDVNGASSSSLAWTLEEAVSLLAGALESVRDPIVIVDLDRRVLRYNRAFLETFGLTGEELTVRGIDAILDACDRVLVDPGEVRAFWQTPPDRAVCDTLHFVDGRVFERHVASHRHGDRIIGRVVTCRDITASLRAERALEEHWSLLEKAQEVAQIGSWALCHYLFEINYQPALGASLLLVVATMAVVTTVGMAASGSILRSKPILILRELTATE